MIEITRFYDPTEIHDQLDVTVSIEVEGTDGERVLELSGELGCSNRLALTRLRSLEEQGKVSSLPVGNTYLWVLNDG